MKRLLLSLLCALALPLRANEALDQLLPVRGLCISAPSAKQVDRFVKFIHDDLAARGVNTLILRVDWNYRFTTHPELADTNGLSNGDVKAIVRACREHGIQVMPQINLLGHQSWATHLGNLLRVYPEFDETPQVKLPEKYAWPNPDKLYCKSYCPLHPKVHEVVFALMDEICEAFESTAFHAGMDEVFYIGEAGCTRCAGKDKAELFAGELKALRDHLKEQGRALWIWGDRLLDGKTTGLGEWEASLSGTHRAIDMVPLDVVICDWHYERADPTAAYFALHGFNVVSCPWTNQKSAVQQVHDMVTLRENAAPSTSRRAMGIVQTVWSGANSFLDDLAALKGGGPRKGTKSTAAECFVRVFEEINSLAKSSGVATPQPKSTQ